MITPSQTTILRALSLCVDAKRSELIERTGIPLSTIEYLMSELLDMHCIGKTKNGSKNITRWFATDIGLMTLARQDRKETPLERVKPMTINKFHGAYVPPVFFCRNNGNAHIKSRGV